MHVLHCAQSFFSSSPKNMDYDEEGRKKNPLLDCNHQDCITKNWNCQFLHL